MHLAHEMVLPPQSHHPNYTCRANSVAFSPDGRFLACTHSGITFEGRSITFGTDFHHYATTWFLDASSLEERHRIEYDSNLFNGLKMIEAAFYYYPLAFSHIGSYCAYSSFADDAIVHLVDMDSWEERTSQALNYWATSLSFSPAARTLSIGTNGDIFGGKKVQIWDYDTSQKPVLLKGHRDDVLTVAYSPDGSVIASGAKDKSVRIWSVPSQSSVHVLKQHKKAVTGLAYTPDGKKLYSCGDDRSIIVWNTAGYIPTDTLSIYDNPFVTVQVSPNGDILAAVDSIGIVHLWTTADGNYIEGLHTETQAPVSAIAFSRDGSKLASVSDGAYLRIWDLGALS